MRLRAWLWLALSSVSAGSLAAGTRPHYGGMLTLDLSGTFSYLGTVRSASDALHSDRRNAGAHQLAR